MHDESSEDMSDQDTQARPDTDEQTDARFAQLDEPASDAPADEDSQADSAQAVEDAEADVVSGDTATEAAAVAEAGPDAATVAEDAPEAGTDEIEAAEDEEEEIDYATDVRFLPGDWYVVHTYAGYENKVRANLGSRIQSMNMEDKIYDVVIPTEEVMEIKAGKKQVVEKKVFPGYILVRMDLDDDSWYVVRNTPGVTGFVGAGARPTPLSIAEVQTILAPPEDEKLVPRLEFQLGEVVSVISGPFAGMSGPIDELNMDQQKVKVLVDIFGRETPVELGFDQVAKL